VSGLQLIVGVCIRGGGVGLNGAQQGATVKSILRIVWHCSVFYVPTNTV